MWWKRDRELEKRKSDEQKDVGDSCQNEHVFTVCCLSLGRRGLILGHHHVCVCVCCVRKLIHGVSCVWAGDSGQPSGTRQKSHLAHRFDIMIEIEIPSWHFTIMCDVDFSYYVWYSFFTFWTESLRALIICSPSWRSNLHDFVSSEILRNFSELNIDFHCVDKNIETFFKISSFMFHRRKRHEGEKMMIGFYFYQL